MIQKLNSKYLLISLYFISIIGAYNGFVPKYLWKSYFIAVLVIGMIQISILYLLKSFKNSILANITFILCAIIVIDILIFGKLFGTQWIFLVLFFTVPFFSAILTRRVESLKNLKLTKYLKVFLKSFQIVVGHLVVLLILNVLCLLLDIPLF